MIKNRHSFNAQLFYALDDAKGKIKTMAMIQMNFMSEYLNGNNYINIILPDRPGNQSSSEFYCDSNKYKVLWLLHPTCSDSSDWIRKTMVEVYACERNLAVVILSGMNSNYVNWQVFGFNYKMHDYLFEELMPMIYSWFPISNKREDNFIAGCSMGGYGAMIYAMSHPEKFSLVAALSAPTYNPHRLLSDKSMLDEAFKVRFDACVINAGGEEAFLNSDENVWDRLSELNIKNKLPRLYYYIGTDDDLFPAYLRFKKYAKDNHIPTVFIEENGYAHEWRFWNKCIEHVMELCCSEY